MKYFFDTEFIDADQKIYPISIGIVAENGDYFYSEVVDEEIPWHLADEWVLANIKPLLRGPKSTKASMAESIKEFIQTYPEFWGWYCDWDWVVINHLCWGKMINANRSWPMHSKDVKQHMDYLGQHYSQAYSLPVQQGTKHDALEDARWTKQVYEYLENLK